MSVRQLFSGGLVVNRDHSLNNGRVMWMLCVPGRTQGTTWRDMMAGMAGTLNGTLTGSPPATGFRGDLGRPGGSGRAWLGDGSAGFVKTPSFGFNYDSMTIAVWVYPLTVSTRAVIIDLAAATTNIPVLESDGFGVAGAIDINVNGSTPASTQAVLVANAWQRIVYVKNGATGSNNGHFFYLNGQAVAFNTNTAVTYTNTATAKNIGQRGDNVRRWNGYLDSVSLSSRPWSAAEVGLDYQLERQGLPGVLLRGSRTWFLNSGAAPSFNAGWATGATKIVSGAF